MFIPGFTRSTFFLLVSLTLFTSCRKVCDNEDAPTYELTPGQRDWTKAFVKNDVWRFRNASGYVRTYRVTRAEMLNESGGGSGKGSLCATYFLNFFAADLERTDSVAHPLETIFRFQTGPVIPSENKPFNAFVTKGARFDLPIDQVEDGRLTLTPATFNGRTYPAVLESSFYPTPPLLPRPTQTGRIFLTKAEGIVRFEEFGGTVWNRL